MNKLGTFSKGIFSIPFLTKFLDAPVEFCKWYNIKKCQAYLGWGNKVANRQVKLLKIKMDPYWRLEDGFLRSYGLGNDFPPLAIIVDKRGIYYDSTCISDLEYLLQNETKCLVTTESEQARKLVIKYRLSKYNHAPDIILERLRPNDRKRILVIDQTLGDLSISYGNANKETFTQMLIAARQENPGATIYVKYHPATSKNHKKGNLDHIQENAQTVILCDAVNPFSILEQMDKIYVVTSQLGFEALLLGKPVTVFGLPWYAGWGCTDDRQKCLRRTRKRSVEELFSAGYIHYTHYLNPYTHQKGTIFDVIDWLIRQIEMGRRFDFADDKFILLTNISRIKRKFIMRFITLEHVPTKFVKLFQIKKKVVSFNQTIICWGSPPGLEKIFDKKPVQRLFRMEDGFIRSVGLGCNYVKPLSLVVDRHGIYFDPNNSSDLEQILNETHFDDKLLKLAENTRKFIVENNITKYNVQQNMSVKWNSQNKKIILIPGQVSEDVSLRLGCTEIKCIFELISIVRANNPDAFIVYKPHPDVITGKRKGKLAESKLRGLIDFIEKDASIISCIEQAEEIHTLTSLAGFDALLRGKRVFTYGEPFYAGWGLTEDKVIHSKSFTRRQKKLSIDELVAGVLVLYPTYYDWILKGYTTCEGTMREIIRQRTFLNLNTRRQTLKNFWSLITL